MLLNEIKKISKEYFSLFYLQIFTAQIMAILLTFVFKNSIYKLHLFLYISLLVSYLLFKDYVNEKEKKRNKKVFNVSFLAFVFISINHFFITLSNNGFMVFSRAMGLSFLINTTVFMIILFFANEDKIKEFLTTLHETSIIEKFFKDEQKNTGDVKLCIDKETNKPVILPFKDRFLHMLILGPTGSGKTSQTIIPMLFQDVQNKEAGITVIEPKGDLAEKIYAMSKYFNRPVVYFNPTDPNCPYFNPLYGKEDDVIENMATTFKMLNPDSPQFFQDMNENLLRNALKVLKRLYGNKATLIDLARLIQNSGGIGRKIVQDFSKLTAETEAIAKENTDIALWFLNDYFYEKSKTYEHCSGLRSQVAKLISNNHLRRVLNPPNGQNDVNFDKHLEEGGVITISTAQGDLRELGKYLGYFIILQFQSAVFRRPGNENTRRPHFLYIDEFQEFANPGFGIMLTQGRSYRVASHLATQNRALMAMGGGRDGKNFVELVSTNARNLVIYPGGNVADAEYYSKQFGEIIERKTQKGISRPKFWIFGGALSGIKESIRESEEKVARFTPSDIIYRPFKEIIYCIVQNNTLQYPAVGKIEFIDKEINDQLDKMVEEYKKNIKKEEKTISKKEIEIEEILTKEEAPDIANILVDSENLVDINISNKDKKEEREEFLDVSFFEDNKTIVEEERDYNNNNKKSDPFKNFSVQDDFL